MRSRFDVLAWSGAGTLILLALAMTSTQGSIRRLKRNWGRLHRLVYVAALAAAVHFLWKVKADTREPLVFLSIIVVLLGVRAWVVWSGGRRGRSGAGPSGGPPG